MKTFVADDYQVTPMGNGGVKVLISKYDPDMIIEYDPDNKIPWSKQILGYTDAKGKLAYLNLSKHTLETFRKVLEVVNRQDLVDREIVFLDKEETQE